MVGKIYTIKIRKLGGSFYISLPPEVTRQLNLEIGSRLEMDLKTNFATFKLSESSKRTVAIKKIGGSLISNIPAQIIHLWNMKAGQSICLQIIEGGFSIKPLKVHYDLKSLLIENSSIDLPRNSWGNK